MSKKRFKTYRKEGFMDRTIGESKEFAPAGQGY